MEYGHIIYIIATFILSLGLYMMLSSNNYIRKIIGLTIFQNSILLFYIAFGKVKNSIIPININMPEVIYTSPIPHVLMLTAIVVGFATLAVALSLVKMIQKEFDSVDITTLEPYL